MENDKWKTENRRLRLLRKKGVATFLSLAFAVSLITASCGSNSGVTPASATSGTCPVCRMRVKASDEWAAEIYYKDQTKLMFESPGDMLAFYTSPNRYGVDDAHKDLTHIERITVKDYQTKQPVDARQAKFVYKSKVDGPMGPDFLPFGKQDDAQTFVTANGGRLLSLSDVTAEMAGELRK